MYSLFNLKILYILSIISIPIYSEERGTYLGCYARDNKPIAFLNYVHNVDVCIDICEDSYMRYVVLDREKCLCANSKAFNQLNSSECNIHCNWSSLQYCGGHNAQSYYYVGLKVAGPAKNISVVNRTENSILIQWSHPDLEELVYQYIIRAVVIKTYAKESLMMPPQWITQKNETKMELVDLHPGTTYNVSITSASEYDEGGTIYFTANTLIGTPDPEPTLPVIVQKTNNAIIINISSPINNNGPVTWYRIIVILIDIGILQNLDENYLNNYNISQENGINYYITAELDLQNQDRRFTIGDGQTYNGYYNAPLPSNSQAQIGIGIVSTLNNITKIRYANLSQQYDFNGVQVTEEDDGQVLLVILIVACCIFGILLVLSVIAYCYLRIKGDSRLQRLPSDHHELSLQGPIIEVENNGYIPDDLSKGNFDEKLNQLLHRIDLNKKYPRNSLTLDIENVIGNGNFGDVINGIINNNNNNNNNAPVNCQVHVISDDMELLHQSQFLKEFDQLLKVESHKSILKFIGYTQTPDWLFLIFEDVACTLKKKLIEARTPSNIDTYRFSSISEEDMLKMLCEISDAFEYLSMQQFIHKKLCSYNVRITVHNQIKLSGFGGTPFDDYGKTIDLSRWNAPEVLKFQHYSNKSDIWSFGCLMWECCCLGGTLYANINSGDLLTRIKNGYRCEQPSFIYDDIYQLMLSCWDWDPSDRPTFTEISFNLRQLMISPQHAISFVRYDGFTLPYYMPLLEVQIT